MYRTIALGMIVIGLALLGSRVAQTSEPAGKKLRAEDARNPHRAVLQGQNAFACELYRRLGRKAEGRDVVISPLSLYQALAMIHAGARGETEREMAGALGFQLPQRETVRALQEVACARACTLRSGATLHTANSLWAHQGLRLLPEYTRLLEQEFGAPARRVDFSADPTAAREAVNGWVSEQTKGEIPRLFDRFDRTTLLVAANAVFFHADWQYPFDPKLTAKGRFNLLNGGHTEVQMMSIAKPLAYAKARGCEVVAIPYGAGSLAMLLILPEGAGGLADVEKQLAPESVGAWCKDLATRNVYLKLPRFAVDSAFELGPTLKDMGMTLAFSDGADLLGIDHDRCIRRVDQVVHRAVLQVDGRGTKAAAATGVVTVRDKVVFEVDRPFLFIVRDQQSGEILFLGRFMGPR